MHSRPLRARSLVGRLRGLVGAGGVVVLLAGLLVVLGSSSAQAVDS